MLGLLLSNPVAGLIFLIGIMLSVTIHEFFHAWTADKLGDPTPRYQGRVTLNPRAHLDPFGTIALILVGFGWGRPVEFDPYNLKNPLKDTAIIALAGPASNIVVAIILSLVLRSGVIPFEWVSFALIQVVFINVSLAIFNLIPVYPLDGSKIALALLPKSTAYEYDAFMHKYGMMVLILLILPIFGGVSAVSQLILPIIRSIMMLLLGISI